MGQMGLRLHASLGHAQAERSCHASAFRASVADGGRMAGGSGEHITVGTARPCSSLRQPLRGTRAQQLLSTLVTAFPRPAFLGR